MLTPRTVLRCHYPFSRFLTGVPDFLAPTHSLSQVLLQTSGIFSASSLFLERSAPQSLLLCKVVPTAVCVAGREDRPRSAVGLVSRKGVYEAHLLLSQCPAHTGKRDTCILGWEVLQSGQGEGLEGGAGAGPRSPPWDRAAAPQMLRSCSSLGPETAPVCMAPYSSEGTEELMVCR